MVLPNRVFVAGETNSIVPVKTMKRTSQFGVQITFGLTDELTVTGIRFLFAAKSLYSLGNCTCISCTTRPAITPSKLTNNIGIRYLCIAARVQDHQFQRAGIGDLLLIKSD